jgi:hypothetical protein
MVKLKQRILREFKEMNIIKFELKEFELENDLKKYTVKFDYEGIHYVFIVSNNYPFTPPKILSINNVPFLLEHKQNDDHVKKQTGLDCFCCDFITSPLFWSPKCKFIDVLRDLERIKKLMD